MMSKKIEIIEIIKEIIENCAPNELKRMPALNEKTIINNLPIDSFGMIEIRTMIEDKYDIMIFDFESINIIKIKDYVNLVKNKLHAV